MDERPTWTDCDEAGDYVVPIVLSPRDLVSRSDNRFFNNTFLQVSPAGFEPVWEEMPR